METHLEKLNKCKCYPIGKQNVISNPCFVHLKILSAHFKMREVSKPISYITPFMTVSDITFLFFNITQNKMYVFNIFN